MWAVLIENGADVNFVSDMGFNIMTRYLVDNKAPDTRIVKLLITAGFNLASGQDFKRIKVCAVEAFNDSNLVLPKILRYQKRVIGLIGKLPAGLDKEILKY